MGFVNESFQEFKDSLNEKRIVTSRVNKNARVRNSILKAISDGVVTQEEFDNILKELNVSRGWQRKNSKFFKITEDGICLSAIGKRIHKGIASPVNESASESSKHFDISDYTDLFESEELIELINKLSEDKQELLDEIENEIISIDEAIAKSGIVSAVIDDYKNITGEEYKGINVSDNAAAKIERTLKKQKIDPDNFWELWLAYKGHKNKK